LPDDYLETYRQESARSPARFVAPRENILDSANMQIVVVGDRAQIGEQARFSAKWKSMMGRARG